MAKRADPREHMCETCDVSSAAWGFTIRYLDESGALVTTRLWFCYAHRADGERLLAISNEAHGSGLAPRPRKPPEAPPAPAPTQGTLDL